MVRKEKKNYKSLCKKLGVRLTTKRVYKSEKVLKKQYKNAIKRIKNKLLLLIIIIFKKKC